MAVTRTFSIIKPDATRRNLTGAVTKMLEDAGLEPSEENIFIAAARQYKSSSFRNCAGVKPFFTSKRL